MNSRSEDSKALDSSVNSSSGLSDALLGQTIDGKVQILEMIGQGSHGTIYKGHHLTLQTDVAVKIFRPTCDDTEISQRRFLNEAQLLSSFKHDHIVGFHSYGTLKDGRNYMVLEYLSGKTLDKILISAGPLDSARVIEIFIQICEALSYAHDKNVIHRDLKPSNIFLVEVNGSETVKLLDFGISKLYNLQAVNLTQTGAVLGTANYMSPEQCKHEQTDIRSDIYSLGIVMYECLVGSAPMQGSTELMTMSNQLNLMIDDVPAPKGISGQLKKVVLKCLNKSAETRFPSCQVLKLALIDCRGITPRLANNFLNRLAIGFLAVILVAITCRIMFQRSSDSASDQIKFQKPSTSPPSDDDLPALEKWINQNAISSDVQPLQLSEKYIKCVPSHRKNHDLPLHLADVVRALEKFRKRGGNTKINAINFYLIQLWSLDSNTESKTLAELKKMIGSSTMGISNEYREDIKALIRLSLAIDHFDLAKKYALAYKNAAFAQKSKYDEGLADILLAVTYSNIAKSTQYESSNAHEAEYFTALGERHAKDATKVLFPKYFDLVTAQDYSELINVCNNLHLKDVSLWLVNQRANWNSDLLSGRADTADILFMQMAANTYFESGQNGPATKLANKVKAIAFSRTNRTSGAERHLQLSIAVDVERSILNNMKKRNLDYSKELNQFLSKFASYSNVAESEEVHAQFYRDFGNPKDRGRLAIKRR